MEKLRDALDDLASDVPAPAPSPELWERGVRRRRRIRASAAAAVLVVVAGGAGALSTATTTSRPDAPPVVSSPDEPALPDRLWSPSPWLEGTDELGPPGPVAMLFWDNLNRATWWGGSRGGFVAVSAVDGSYRYVDELADVDAFAPVLSPDGRYVAFPSLRADAPAAGAEPAADGYAVYDAVTGGVSEHRVQDAPQGVDPGLSPVWTPDSSTLLVELCRIDRSDADGFACTGIGADVLDVASGEVHRLPDSSLTDVVGRTDDALLLELGDGEVGTLDAGTGAVTPVGRLDLSALQERSFLHLDEESGTVTVAGRRDDDTVSGRLELARFPLGGAPTWRPAPVRGYAEVLGPWRDGGLLLLQAEGPRSSVRGVGLAGRGSEVSATDVATVVAVEEGFSGSNLQTAWDLATRPSVDRPEPDEPTDPRLLPAAGLALLLLGGVAAAVRLRRRLG